MPILDNGATRRATTLSFLALAAAAPPAAAQRLLFPDVAPFDTPLGDPRPAGIYGRLLDVRRGESLYGAEREAEAAAGESFPVFALSRSANPVVIGMSLGVAARFSLDDPRSALISTDWTVGIRGRATPGPWVLDLHFYHESSHLGDEYAQRFDVSRIDWTREVGTLSLERRLGAFTAHGRLSYTLIDELALDRWAAAVALDFRAKGSRRILGAEVRPVAGVFVDGAAYASWKLTTVARAGVELAGGRRALAISLIGLDGLSTQRQFFRNRSRYLGFELRFDL
ncbi:MAG: DUF1207 domain-containing protein [Gemmatimonadales bacterium]